MSGQERGECAFALNLMTQKWRIASWHPEAQAPVPRNREGGQRLHARDAAGNATARSAPGCQRSGICQRPCLRAILSTSSLQLFCFTTSTIIESHYRSSWTTWTNAWIDALSASLGHAAIGAATADSGTAFDVERGQRIVAVEEGLCHWDRGFRTQDIPETTNF